MIAGINGLVGTVLLQTTVDSESIASAILVFLISLIIGVVAIHLAAQVLIDRDTGFRRATLTALLGAIVYAVVGLFLGWIPILGPLLMLLAWVGVIKWLYPGGWGTAIGIGIVAWAIALLILAALSALDIVTPEVLGIPGL